MINAEVQWLQRNDLTRLDYDATPVRKHHKLLSTMSQRNDHEYCPLLGKRHSQKQMANREERESKIRRSSREKRTSYIKHTILALPPFLLLK